MMNQEIQILEGAKRNILSGPPRCLEANSTKASSIRRSTSMKHLSTPRGIISHKMLTIALIVLVAQNVHAGVYSIYLPWQCSKCDHWNNPSNSICLGRMGPDNCLADRSTQHVPPGWDNSHLNTLKPDALVDCMLRMTPAELDERLKDAREGRFLDFCDRPHGLKWECRSCSHWVPVDEPSCNNLRNGNCPGTRPVAVVTRQVSSCMMQVIALKQLENASGSQSPPGPAGSQSASHVSPVGDRLKKASRQTFKLLPSLDTVEKIDKALREPSCQTYRGEPVWSCGECTRPVKLDIETCNRCGKGQRPKHIMYPVLRKALEKRREIIRRV